jgi:predicted DCC family thiol-disulfide oxidoreductase YuxK
MMGLLRRAVASLDRHWFAPASLAELAVVRIVVTGSTLLFFMPSRGWVLESATAADSAFLPLPALKVLMLPFGGWGIRPSAEFLTAAWFLALVSGLFALAGLLARPAMLLFAATNTLMVAHIYSYGDMHHPHAMMVIALWVLAFAPIGSAISLDRLRERLHVATRETAFPQEEVPRLSPLARWPLRTIQWCLVLAYLSGGLSKLVNGGSDWLNGHTMSYYLIQDGILHNVPVALWIQNKLVLTTAMSFAALLFELTFAVAVLVPSLTWFYVLMGVGFHTGIYWTMRAPFFTFLALYIVFIETLRRRVPLAHRFRRRARARWIVLYDGLCPRCIRTAVILDELDWAKRLDLVDFERETMSVGQLAPGVTLDDARRAMHIVSPDGTLHVGFFAIRRLARLIPGLWPIVPLLYAPGALRIGPRIYAAVAGRRRRIACRAGVCNL